MLPYEALLIILRTLSNINEHLPTLLIKEKLPILSLLFVRPVLRALCFAFFNISGVYLAQLVPENVSINYSLLQKKIIVSGLPILPETNVAPSLVLVSEMILMLGVVIASLILVSDIEVYTIYDICIKFRVKSVHLR